MLTRPKYTVVLQTEQGLDERTVEVSPGDQFRAELEAARNGLPAIQAAPLSHTGVWIWCALVREGTYSGDYQQFRNADLYAFEPADDDGEAPAPVDPTTAVTFDSGSS